MTLWSKVWRDLMSNKARTLLAILSTAVGIFALGVVFGIAGTVQEQLLAAHHAASPAHITFWGGPFPPEALDAVAREPGVQAVEGETVTHMQWKLPGDTEWNEASLTAREDFSVQQVNLLRLEEGNWPEDHALLVERMSAAHFDLAPGSVVVVDFDGREREVTLSGVARSHWVDPPAWGGDAAFFAALDDVVWLTGNDWATNYNNIYVQFESFDQASAEASAEQIEDRLARMALPVEGYRIDDPDVHWLQDMISAVMIVLMVMGILSLALSGFMIVNTMNSIIVQQTWQIGVMKAVGATLLRVLRVYLATALVYGVLALLIAAPLGTLGSYVVSGQLLAMFNIEIDAFSIAPLALLLQIVMGVTVPPLAALIPVLAGVRTTVHEAISSHGIETGFGENFIDRLVGRIRFLPRPLVMALRNMFRRKVRLALTLLTLTLSGMMFIMVLSARDSFNGTISDLFDVGEDVIVHLDDPNRTARLEEIAAGVPGVQEVEVWTLRQVMVLLPGGEEHAVYIHGVPAGSTMFTPQIIHGRTLVDGDAYALLVDNRLAEEQGWVVGDLVTLSIGGEESAWTIVGTVMSANALTEEFFVPLDALGQETGLVGQGSSVKVTCGSDDLETQLVLGEALRQAYEAQRIEVASIWSATQQQVESRQSFGAMVYALLAMTVLIASVGCIGLMSTMSINVVERQREIGVMRAIGASSMTVAGIFVGEGVVLGVLSWLLALPLSLPGARLFSNVIGMMFIRAPLNFSYAVEAIGIWLIIVLALSVLASLLPAIRAAQVSVRESLTYE